MKSVLIRHAQRETCRGKRPCENGSREWSGVTSQGMHAATRGGKNSASKDQPALALFSEGVTVLTH